MASASEALSPESGPYSTAPIRKLCAPGSGSERERQTQVVHRHAGILRPLVPNTYYGQWPMTFLPKNGEKRSING